MASPPQRCPQDSQWKNWEVDASQHCGALACVPSRNFRFLIPLSPNPRGLETSCQKTQDSNRPLAGPMEQLGPGLSSHKSMPVTPPKERFIMHKVQRPLLSIGLPSSSVMIPQNTILEFSAEQQEMVSRLHRQINTGDLPP